MMKLDEQKEEEEEERELEIILLGTGTSSAVPSIGCLVSKEKGCYCCRSTLNLTNNNNNNNNNNSTNNEEEDKELRKNIRRNTSALIRIHPLIKENDKRIKSLLIDCGKTFYSGATEHWPRHNLKEIDGILITHPHSDAILGLDDLRGWTLHQHIQKSIDIYANQSTYNEISKAFPYLCDSKKATGGGDVPALQWHIINDLEPFTILGIRIVPLPVHHGKFFTTPPTPYPSLGFLFNSTIVYLSDVSFIPETTWDVLERECTLPEIWRPSRDFEALGEKRVEKEKGEESIGLCTPPLTPSTLLENPLLQLSISSSTIPSSSTSSPPPLINGHSLTPPHSLTNGNTNGIISNLSKPQSQSRLEKKEKEKPKLKVLILDCLRIESHTSHFGIGQSIEAARRMGAVRTYLIGFGHATSHSSWTHALTSFSLSHPSSLPLPPPPLPLPKFIPPLHPWELFEGTSTPGIEDENVFKQSLLRAILCWEGVRGGRGGFWVRAGCDGLRVTLGKGEGGEEVVRDSVYDA